MVMEIWVVFWAIDEPISLWRSAIVETFTRAASVPGGVIPASLGALEASNVAVVRALGLTAGAGSLALSRRVRGLFWAAPGTAALSARHAALASARRALMLDAIRQWASELGGVGLFVLAALDSSFLSFPQVNDLLIIYLSTKYPVRMPYYAGMTTARIADRLFRAVFRGAGGAARASFAGAFSGAARQSRHGALSAPRTAGRDRSVASAAASTLQAVRAARRCRARVAAQVRWRPLPSDVAFAISARAISRFLYGERAAGAGPAQRSRCSALGLPCWRSRPALFTTAWQRRTSKADPPGRMDDSPSTPAEIVEGRLCERACARPCADDVRLHRQPHCRRTRRAQHRRCPAVAAARSSRSRTTCRSAPRASTRMTWWSCSCTHATAGKARRDATLARCAAARRAFGLNDTTMAGCPSSVSRPLERELEQADQLRRPARGLCRARLLPRRQGVTLGLPVARRDCGATPETVRELAVLLGNRRRRAP